MSGPTRVSGRALAALAATVVVAAPAGARAQDLAITGGRVHPVSGPAIDGATVLIRNGLIVGVGTDVVVPPGVEVIDASGRIVTPGFFDATTSLGLVEVGSVQSTRDDRAGEDYVQAAFDVVDGINPRSTLIPINRLGGITTVLSRPSGGLIAGQAAILDLDGTTLGEMIVRRRAAMIAAYGPDAAEAAGGARGAASLRLREVLEDALFWRDRRDDFDRGLSRPVAHSRLDLEALQPVLAGEMPLVVSADRASDIEAVLRLAEEYGLRLVIDGGAEAWLAAERLAAADVPVILKPLSSAVAAFDQLGARFDNAALLDRAGVAVAIGSYSSHNARWLGLEAGNAVRFGLPWETALRAVTLEPARMFGVSDRYGSLEPGKVGNVVVWSGDPFEVSARAELVVIRGRSVPARSRQTELLERYRELDGSPPAYRGRSEVTPSQ